MPATPFEILDTTAGDTGATQTLFNREQRRGRPMHIQAEIGAGDTVVIEGKVESTLSFVTLATFTANDIKAIDLPNIYRARRTVDGGGADSNVFVEVFLNAD